MNIVNYEKLCISCCNLDCTCSYPVYNRYDEPGAGADFYFAFSGGTTPSLMFDIWAHEFREETPWMRMRIFWVDERCVSVSDSDSNYGTMLRLLLQEVGMPDEYVYPIHGDCRSPAQEAKRYSDLVSSTVPLRRGFPTFDIVLLGAGDDGHTSSIFPGQEYLLSSFIRMKRV